VALTRDDEPGSEDDPADHRGTVLRLVARDTEVARHLAAYAREHGPAWVVAGTGEYGTQLDGQLRLVGLPRAADPDAAAFALVAGVADEPGMERARETGLPVIAFDGVQGLDLGAGRDVRVVLPFAEDPTHGIEAARAARLVADALAGGATTRAEVLAACRAAGPFDAHGDPVDPPVWLWRADEHWRLSPERAI
jgi:ABC-type sugar transport system substrate-binding protein